MPETVRYARILRYVEETPWAIDERTGKIIAGILARRMAGERLSKEEIRAQIGAQNGATVGAGRSGGTAVIPLHGVVTYRADMFDEVSGMVSLERFATRFREALANDDVSSILLHIDSPGGSVDGVPEMAREIMAARGQKRIVAVADTLAASAAYWIGSAADELVVTPSGEVGSIGVFAMHIDESAALEAEGVNVSFVSAGRYKTEGNPFEPLGEEARGAIQARVDDYYGMFVADVAKGRGVKVSDVRGGFGEGRVVGARDAVAEGMADRVATFQQAVADMRSPPRRRRSSSAERLKRKAAFGAAFFDAQLALGVGLSRTTRRTVR